MDRPFPEPHPFDPDEDNVELRPDRDPDDVLEREFEDRREAAHAHGRWRCISACIDQTGGRFR